MTNSTISSYSRSFENLLLPGRQQQVGVDVLQKGPSRNGDQLSAAEQRRLDELKAADRKVRAHEQAHIRVGGDLVRGASLSYETGPDSKRYAVAGEVSIDTSKGRTPEETIPKARHIRETALAPADPSPQDRRVASLASQMEMQAQQQLAAQAASERARADSAHGNRAIGAYQAAGGLEKSTGFVAVA